MSQTVLVVDDEEDLRELLRYNLEKDGFNVRCAESGEKCIEIVRDSLPDVIVLDLMLPGRNGLEVCSQLKSDSRSRGIPVIILSARAEEVDIVHGLEEGADDYITKPFSPRVLSARVRRVLRGPGKAHGNGTARISFGELCVDSRRREVTIDSNLVALTNTEFKILFFLLKQPGAVCTREEIIEGVHGDDYPVTDRSIDVQVVGLRRKLGRYGRHFETVRGVGYRFADS